MNCPSLKSTFTVLRPITLPFSSLMNDLVITQSLLNTGSADNSDLSAKDKDVIVIGGGDTGTDCIGTALRQGAKSI
jgi:hypothetical protein